MQLSWLTRTWVNARALARRLPRYEDFDDFQIEDLYHEIFLGAVVERSQVEVYK